MPSRYLLDTNVVVHVANKATGWENIITKMETSGHGDISISAVTVWEIYRMAERAKVKQCSSNPLYAKNCVSNMTSILLFAV